MVRMMKEMVGNRSFTLTSPPVTTNEAGHDASKMASHRDPSWHPFSSASTPLTCQSPSSVSIHTPTI